MILGFGGLPGAGKTYSMIERARKWRGKRPIFSNMNLTWAEEFSNLSELRLVTNALVLIDEAGIWFNSRKWNKLDEETMAWFAQHRKHGCDMMWTAQRVMGVDSSIRGLTQQYAECLRVGNLIVHRWFDGASGKPMGKSFVMLKREVYDLYDTLAFVGFADGRGRGVGGAAEGRTERWLDEALKGAICREEQELPGLGARYRPASVLDLLRGREVLRRVDPGGRGRGRLQPVELPPWLDLEGLRHLAHADMLEGSA